MNTFARWTTFALATAVAAIAGALLLLVMGRLYGGLLSPEFTFGALVAFCVGVTLASIAYGSKLEDERAAIEAAEAALMEGPIEPEERPDR
ncbi:hypothetical protein [Hansschlegelia zhihuaiae]|uniref:YiaAB two helix domain-containing protein n=1 Tax=Hansschlegelia zhihuaiae TaxID=405005 RepID=A0A4Q0MP58_9HYPH|nr:hypothetical protein [Hansschlegelia zhihuaiae]RXF75443.1 hypothetical protein EK403_00875 [Hansschlegelia zhihuaiae]